MHRDLHAFPTRRSADLSTARATLVLACCDPAAGLLSAEYARTTGDRLLVFHRSGAESLDLLGAGRVHVAGLHYSTKDQPEKNVDMVRRRLGDGYRLLRVADWEEGVALPVADRCRSASMAVCRSRRVAAREPGSGARACLDELLNGRPVSGRIVSGHAAVACAVRDGWADAGVCVRLSASEARLRFLPVRTESLDLCYAEDLHSIPRIRGLVSLLRSRAYRQLLGDLPGYDTTHTGAMMQV